MVGHRITNRLCPIVAAVMLQSLAACAPASPPSAETAPQPEQRPTVIDPQLRALDQAKGVETEVLDAARRSIDEADAGPR